MRSALAIRAAAIAICLSPARAAGQDIVKPLQLDSSELRWIQCRVASIDPVRVALENGGSPLLVISGTAWGPLDRPQGDCATESSELAIREVDFIRPHTARDLFGPDGLDGVVLVEIIDRRRCRRETGSGPAGSTRRRGKAPGGAGPRSGSQWLSYRFYGRPAGD